MTRFQRLSPALLTALLAACSEAQPYVQPVAPVASQAVVVDAGLGDRTAKLDLRAVAAYALQQATTVHRWVPADLVRYDVELRVRNAAVATQYDAIGNGLAAHIPVNAQGAGTATFTKLQAGKLYRAYVKAMGKAGGASAQGTEVQMNANAQNDHVDFDFTAANDVASQVDRTVTVTFDNVAFSGTGGLSFGTPSPGAYVGPSEGPAVAVSNPPAPSVSPSLTPPPTNQGVVSRVGLSVGSSLRGLTVAGDGSVWVANGIDAGGAGQVLKLSSLGSLLFTVDVGPRGTGVAINSDGSVWVQHQAGLTKLSSSGSLLTSVAISGLSANYAYEPAVDSQGQLWVSANGGNAVYKLSSSGAILASVAVPQPKRLAVDAQDRVWVPAGGSSVHLLNNAASLLAAYTVGNNPTDVAIGAQGQVWVVNSNSHNVSLLASNGSLLGTFSVGGTPFQVALDAQGAAWVTNYGSGNVTHLASNGSHLATYSITFPVGIAVDRSRATVWVGSLLGDVFTIR